MPNMFHPTPGGMLIITFTNEEMAQAYMWAIQRQQIAERGRVRDARVAGIDSIETHCLGILGDWALAKAVNVDYDNPNRPHTPQGVGGLRVGDVTLVARATRLAHGRLMSKMGKRYAPNTILVLIHVDGNVADLRGWATVSQLLQDRNIEDKGYGPTYFMAVD